MTEHTPSPKVTIATASAIIVHPTDPYRVLVADSAKHPHPVLPGGKVERTDAADGTGALSCIKHELLEEIGAVPETLTVVGVATDPTRDVRSVPYKKIKTAVFSPALPVD